MKTSIAASQWSVLTYLWQHSIGKSGRDVSGRVANSLIKRGLVSRSIAFGKRGGPQMWYELTKAGHTAVEKTLTNPAKAPLSVRPRTHDEDLQAAIDEQLNAIKASKPIVFVPEARRLQQKHEFVVGRRAKGRTGEPVCDRCGKTREEGAHPQPTKRELAQKQREEVDQILRNAETDFNSLECNVQDIEVADNTLTKTQKRRLQSLKEDIENLLEQWPC